MCKGGPAHGTCKQRAWKETVKPKCVQFCGCGLMGGRTVRGMEFFTATSGLVYFSNKGKVDRMGWCELPQRRALYLWRVGFRGPVVKLLLQVLASLFCLQQLLLKLQKLLPGHRRAGLLLQQLQIPGRRWATRHSGPQGLHLKDKVRAGQWRPSAQEGANLPQFSGRTEPRIHLFMAS